MGARDRKALITWLYGRDGCWLDRMAPKEWPALAVLLRRILLGRPSPGPFQRSLVPMAGQGSTSGHR